MGSHPTQVGLQQPPRGCHKLASLKGFHSESLDNANPAESFLKNIRDFLRFVLALAAGSANLTSDIGRRKDRKGNQNDRCERQMPIKIKNHHQQTEKSKGLLQKIRGHMRDGIL